jgi:IS4 transposase
MHLKVGLMKNFVKAMNQEKAAFTYLREKIPRLSEAKLKEGIFIGPQIRDLIKEEYFDKRLQGDEKAAWDTFKFVVKGFSWKQKSSKL